MININKMIQRVLLGLILFMSSYSSAQTLIGQRTLRFTDSTRNRPVVTELWYPTTDTLKTSDHEDSPFIRGYTVRNGSFPATKYPLIMISH
ncbi:hypothetical protein H7F33_08805 [Pedobacter sp. PAMC26386]|nr:hypothetical protein H7F33_08805 [Pedobacter sp. PAMC26386]